MSTLLATPDWGPVGVWVGAAATASAALVALLAGTGRLDKFRRPHLQLAFQPVQPWMRDVATDRGSITWLRVSADNIGHEPARGCIGRLTALTTDGTERTDIDPVQLRWAGVPRSHSFHPVDLRRGQREYLNIVHRRGQGPWQIDTFTGPDFDPGFPTTLDPRQTHRLTVALYSDNADTSWLEIILAPSAA
jgi:hypothetical protein